MNGEAVTEGVYMNPKDATAYRGLCARLNYLGQDRPDIRYFAKEASRGMANPMRTLRLR